jgi:type IV secretory pathway VirB2 component (pilin)
VIKGLLCLVGGTALFWGAVTYPAGLLWPDDPTFRWSTAAAVICLVPTALTLAWTRWAYAEKAEQQLLAVMGGTAVRLVAVIAAGMILFLNVKEFEYQRFWIFLIVYYLVTLALEMVLIVRHVAAAGQAR